jgi:predicted RNase H-like HicB family nuclease
MYNILWRSLMLVKIETYFDGEFWCARGIGEDIFTQGKTLDELHHNIQEAVALHFGDSIEPITILTLSEVQLTNAKATTR